jgi:hypothetical protein
MMKDIKAEAVATEIRLRAMAVAAGLATEQEAEKWIVVKAGEIGKGSFKGIELPSFCEGCGTEHSHEEWTPLEIGISREMPEKARDTLFFLMNQGGGSGTVN